MLVRALSILLTLSLGACSISGLLPDWTSTDVAGPEPAYRFIIANALQPIVGDPAKAGALEISSARRVDSVKGASWVVFIKAQGIPTAVYYPKPLHRLEAYRSFPVVDNGIPVTDQLAEEVISLPMHAYLDVAAQDRVIEAVRAALKP